MFRDLTRKNKQISDQECIEILINEKRGILSVIGDYGYPYGVPMNHYYNTEDGFIYFHCGKQQSHRNDSIKENPKVSFCVVDNGTKIDGDWVLNFRSVIVFGKITVVDDLKSVVDISRKLCRKFTDDEEYINNEIENFSLKTLLLKLEPEHICGKTVTES